MNPPTSVAMDPSLNMHTKDDVEAKMRSDLKPFVAQRDEEKSDLPMTAAQIIPEIPYDPAFLALRHTLFRIDSKSATPLAHLIYKGLDGRELCDLLDGVCGPVVYEKERNEWLAQSEDIKLAWPPYARFQAKLAKARKIYAINLRDAGLEDVDVAYTDHEATYSNYADDRSSIGKAGGQIYHYYPLDQETRTMRTSIIVNSKLLRKKIFPPKRLRGGYITLTVNTPQAQAVVSPTAEFKGSIFAYLSPMVPGREHTDSTETAPKLRLEYIDKKIAAICDKRVRSESIQAIRDAEQQPWNTYASGLRPDQPQPAWSPSEVPFRQYAVSDNNAFWKKDLAIRRALIDDYNRANFIKTVDKNGQSIWECRTTNKPPNEAIPNVDYPLVPELCGTYTADRNPRWYRENVIKAQAKEEREARMEAEPRYQKHLAQSMKHNSFVGFHVAQSRMSQNRHDSQYQAQVKKMMGTQIALDHRIRNEKGGITLLREAEGVFPAGVAKGLDGECEPPALPSPLSPTAPQRETRDEEDCTPHPGPMPEGPVHWRNNFAETHTTEHERRQVVPSHHRAAKGDITPFPKYEDPMAGNAGAEDEQHTKPTKTKKEIAKLREEAKLRKATGKSITGVLADTGIRRKQPISLKATAAEKSDNSDELSPVTPSDLLGLVHRVEDGRNAKLSVAASELLSVPGGAIEEGKGKEKLLHSNLPVIIEEGDDI